MKLKFIENLLSGAKVELVFFKIENQRDIKIIDGHHVIVSILDFFHGRINPFGHKHIEFKNKLGFTQDYNLELKFYTFEDWEEVGKFYIDMNENITHSKADIQKAKDWFLDKKISYFKDKK